MALNFYGRDGRFTRQHFLDGGERLGLPGRAVGRMLDDLVAGAAAWIERSGEIGFDDPTSDRLATFLGDRAATLS